MLVDNFNREVNYLRVSVTNQCNFRCLYCMPNRPFSFKVKERLLSFDELFLFIKVAIDEGIRKIRITGGEPLLRDRLEDLISLIYNYKNDIDLSLTTNGYLLAPVAKRLKYAGLKRVNISLDSLNRKTAEKIAQKDILPEVLSAIEISLKIGLLVKINMVVLKGVNDSEILDMLEFCKNRDIEVRFIEYMENKEAIQNLNGLLGKEILYQIKKRYRIRKIGREGSSPSFSYILEDGYKFGLIDPHKHDFCQTCNRIRLTAEGELIPCLYFDEAMSIKDAVKNGDIKKAANILKTLLKNRPKENRWGHGSSEASHRAFYETGG